MEEIWTKEEIIDAFVFAVVAGLIGFMTGLIFQLTSAWLQKTRWEFGGG